MKIERHISRHGTILTALSGDRVYEIEVDPYRDGRSVRAVKKELKRHFPPPDRVTRRTAGNVDQ
jgi:hypothetical protein